MLRFSRHILTMFLIAMTLWGLASQGVLTSSGEVADLTGASGACTELSTDEQSSSRLSPVEEKRGGDVEPEDSFELWGFLENRLGSSTLHPGESASQALGRLLSASVENRSSMFRPPRA